MCHLPSLVLVTGMLWTVLSLKQEPVNTCSSTELNTHACRSKNTHTQNGEKKLQAHNIPKTKLKLKININNNNNNI